MIITLVFEKNANFFAENCQKSQKIVIITSTPGHPGCNHAREATLTGRYRKRSHLTVNLVFVSSINS
jgi:hypothetical protein